MVDWNKDVKLSDLLGRKKAADTVDQSIPESAEAPNAKTIQPEAVAPTPAPTPAAPVAVSPAPPAPPAPAQVTPVAAVQEDTLPVTAEAVAAPPATPWYKADLSFGKKSKNSGDPKQKKAPKEPKQAKENAPKEK